VDYSAYPSRLPLETVSRLHPLTKKNNRSMFFYNCDGGLEYAERGSDATARR